MPGGVRVRARPSRSPISAPTIGSREFAPAALAAGLAAVFTFPLRHGDGRLGALDLYRDTPGELDPHDMGAAQTMADVAAAYLLNAQARDEARATSERFHHDALHDPLTGLANRVLLQERLEHAAERRKRSHTSAAILFADLDRFKQVNDTHGHQVGDELLVAVAHRLSNLVRSGDTLARFSGDEFVFLCEDLHSIADAEILAKRVDEAFAEPFELAAQRAHDSRSRPASASRSPDPARRSPTSSWSKPTWRCTRPSATAAPAISSSTCGPSRRTATRCSEGEQ